MKAIKFFLIALFAFLAFSCAEEPILRDGEDDDPPIIIGGGGTPGGGGTGGGGSGGGGGNPRMSKEQKVQQDSVIHVKF